MYRTVRSAAPIAGRCTLWDRQILSAVHTFVRTFVTRCVAVLGAVLIATVTAAAEGGYRTLGWDDLVPTGKAIDNPITKLSFDQQLDVESLIVIRNLQRRGVITDVSEDAEEAIEIRPQAEKTRPEPGHTYEGLRPPGNRNKKAK